MYTIKSHQKYPYVTIVSIPFEDISKIDFALCEQPTETPDHYYDRKKVKPDIITNGGFFTLSNGETTFGFKDEGNTISVSDHPVVGISGDKSLTYGNPKDIQCRDYVSAYPPLVEKGKSISVNYAKEIDYNARRTAIGWNDTTYFIVTVESPGLRFSVLSEIFIEIGAQYAINLDGGGSTRLLVNGERKTDIAYARPVDNVMCVYLKETPVPEKKIYRVQVGAFSNKKFAEALLVNLKSTGFSDAYLRIVDGYYKIQVGAFTVYLNAERLYDRLVASGYNPIITTR